MCDDQFDDPAYFGGYMTDNFMAVAEALPITQEELVKLSLNAIEASFISDNEKQKLTDKVMEFNQEISTASN